ncbi:hypothetical protein MMYC01_207824 [Madurella mycetomatis]|uniref:Uncharacterized protein n=1 Tax=Madurella mycetomatis TaxID=100816 RepID=A0A175VUU2_9PEZI|nr:hypothetical protein MMYC01_207824 [Madurella mycetomatis]
MIHKRSTPTGKLRLHTHKNHVTYNGTLHLPIGIHVCVPATINNSYKNHAYNPSRREQQPFSITLLYEHNRACEIYRSLDEFVTLSRALVTAPFPDVQLLLPGKSGPQSKVFGNGGSGEGGSDTLGSPATYPSGSSPCGYSGCGTARMEEGAQFSLGLDGFLERAIRTARREPG